MCLQQLNHVCSLCIIVTSGDKQHGGLRGGKVQIPKGLLDELLLKTGSQKRREGEEYTECIKGNSVGLDSFSNAPPTCLSPRTGICNPHQ